jgi:capsular exopolysaccharide synthesis family protein
MSEEKKFLAKRDDFALTNKEDINNDFDLQPYTYRQLNNPPNSELNFYLKILFKYKWSIAICIGVALTSTWYLLSKVQPLYLASSTIQIDPETIDPLNNKTKYYQAWLDPEYFNTQLKLLSNPTLAKQVVETLNLKANSDFVSNKPTSITGVVLEGISTYSSSSPNGNAVEGGKGQDDKEIAGLPDSPEIQKQEDEKTEMLAGAILGSLQVSPVSKTRLVSISFRHHDPKMAEQVANAVAITFIKNNLTKRTGSSQNASNFLQKRLAELQFDINQAEQELINYAKAHEIISLTGEENTVAERLITLNKQLLEAEFDRKQAEAEYKVVKSGMPDDSIPEVQSNKTIQTLQERLSSLKQKREELLSVYTEEWPEYKQVIQTIKQIEKDIQSEKGKIVNGIEIKYTTALEREKLLKTDFEKQMGTTLKQNENAINYKIKQQEIETKKELYKTILSQLKETDISASSDINNIILATRAIVPKGEVSPQRSLAYIWTLFFSSIVAFGIALLREHLNNKIKSVEDIDRFVKLPTLGSIPNFKAPQLLDGGTSIFDLPESNAAEAYRHLRTSIILSPQKQNKIILVTSGQPEEGKTLTAINIAISLAHTGARTVIIEADLRKPNLHPLFQYDGPNGLTQYLSGYTSLENLIQETDIPNLSTIPLVGQRPMYPAELLGSPRMLELLKYLASTRDYVIIDTPPVLPFADAAILSAHADSVLVVVNAERSRREIVRRTCRILEDVRANILGIVLNNVAAPEISYDYSYRYKYNRESASSVFKRAVAAIREIGTSELPQTTDDMPIRIKDIEIKDDENVKTDKIDQLDLSNQKSDKPKPNIQIVLTKDSAQRKLIKATVEPEQVKTNHSENEKISEENIDQTELLSLSNEDQEEQSISPDAIISQTSQAEQNLDSLKTKKLEPLKDIDLSKFDSVSNKASGNNNGNSNGDSNGNSNGNGNSKIAKHTVTGISSSTKNLDSSLINITSPVKKDTSNQKVITTQQLVAVTGENSKSNVSNKPTVTINIQ